MLAVIFLYLFFELTFATEVKLQITQDSEDDGPSFFSFKCSVEDYDDERLAFIDIYRQVSSSGDYGSAHKEQIAYITALTPNLPIAGPGFERVTLHGQIDFESDPETYLEVLFSSLTIDDLGLYTCRATLVDEDEQFTFKTAEARLAGQIGAERRIRPVRWEIITEIPVVATETTPTQGAPADTTPEAVTEATSPPAETTVAVETTAVPEETTTAVDETTIAPEETTVVVDETTGAPVETTVVVDETTGAPVETTVVAEETTGAPVETTVVVDETTVAPVETTIVVEETTGAPVETTVIVDETTVAPVETTIVVEETTVAPEDTTVAVEETTIIPEETTIAPEETTVADEETTTIPEITEPDADALAVTVEALAERLDIFNETVLQLERRLAALDARDVIPETTSAPADKPDVVSSYFVYENASYIFIKPGQDIDVNIAQTACESKTFYLTEVNSEGELQAIADEISPHIIEEAVILVGGQKKVDQDVWLFQGSQEQVDFFAWGAGEPTTTLDNECLALRKSQDSVNMVAVPCSSSSNNFFILCEHDD